MFGRHSVRLLNACRTVADDQPVGRTPPVSDGLLRGDALGLLREEAHRHEPVGHGVSDLPKTLAEGRRDMARHAGCVAIRMRFIALHARLADHR